ncbi:hypothetical protein [Methylobacillus sp.]|uniref:hypothetical protein n=1 Tax=Methylobacillus sp. TaxID=56818 RepID=UPI0012D24CC5|nr:hypothetical protein [Methylobacillus sp.]MPS48524.1 hypothetical protein [Methylobacillus sp.]
MSANSLTVTDKTRVAMWLRSCASLNDVMSSSTVGIVGNVRHTHRAQRVFYLLWVWSVPRFSDKAGAMHDKYYNRMGGAAYARRIERCQRIIRLLKRNY